MGERRVAIVFGSVPGVGGLGMQAATAIASFARGGDHVITIGPGRRGSWPLDDACERIDAIDIAPHLLVGRRVGLTPLRWRMGFVQWVNDVALGRAAAKRLDEARPDLVYVFTQVAEETLAWCRTRGVPSILDNPNGHIRNFARVCDDQWRRWCGGVHHGHPVRAMVRRVEREYALADRVRVSSAWAKGSMLEGGVPEDRVTVVDQPLDLVRFSPEHAAPARPRDAPLRVCYAGSVDVRKGVFYLLRAIRAARARIEVTLVGSTGARATARVLARESEGLDVTIAPGDPVPAYRAADLFVLPSLEDGFGFVVAEAMACGLPVIATDQSGAAEWVARADAGWVVPAGNAAALTRALDDAIVRRDALGAMGARGRAYVESRAANERCFAALRDFAWQSKTD